MMAGGGAVAINDDVVTGVGTGATVGVGADAGAGAAGGFVLCVGMKCGARSGASTANSFPRVRVWLLLLCSSALNRSSISALAGVGDEGRPSVVKITVLGCVAVCVWPLIATVIRWPKTKIA